MVDFSALSRLRLGIHFHETPGRSPPQYHIYCTILIDLTWGVTCDQINEILTMCNVGVT